MFKIIATGKYVPDNIIKDESIEEKNGLEEGYIYKRSGIKTRFIADKDQSLDTLAIMSVKDMISKYDVDISQVDMIITASTTFDSFMPSVSFKVRDYFKIENCMCQDVLAGCSGFVNAIDIARQYIQTKSATNVIVIGAEMMSKNTYDSLKSQILFGDGAGCVYLSATDEEKMYKSKIVSFEDKNNILSCTSTHELEMNGKEVYKFAITYPPKVVEELLKEAKISKEEIKMVIPHQSNEKIMEKIASKIDMNMYTNISKYANTFCASIPIALDELFFSKSINEKDKIILLGYGGGLNVGCILMEV